MEKECASTTEVGEGPSICNPPENPAERHAAATRQPAAYGTKVWVERPYDEMLHAAKKALEEEGFEIVSEVDVRKLLRRSLDIQFPHYTILGAIHPQTAHQALDLDRDSGLLMPFNVIVYEQADGTIIEAIDPIAHLSIAGGRDLMELAREIKQKLQDAIDHAAASLA